LPSPTHPASFSQTKAKKSIFTQFRIYIGIKNTRIPKTVVSNVLTYFTSATCPAPPPPLAQQTSKVPTSSGSSVQRRNCCFPRQRCCRLPTCRASKVSHLSSFLQLA